MSAATQTGGRAAVNRRSLLYATTALVGAAGAAMAAWPLVDQMNPDARSRAAVDILKVDLAGLQPAEQRLVRWRNYPIFVARRTQPMLEAMQDKTLLMQLYDPDSQTRQQPFYANNWHRSIEPAFAVMVGICTKCRTIPSYYAGASPFSMAGGYSCPSCASRYDPAGRAYAGITRYNLPVPPHSFVAASAIAIGANASDETFSLDSVEQI